MSGYLAKRKISVQCALERPYYGHTNSARVSTKYKRVRWVSVIQIPSYCSFPVKKTAAILHDIIPS